MIKDLKANLKPILRLTLIMSFPLLVVIFMGWFVMPFTRGYLKEVSAFVCVTIIFIALSLQFKNIKTRRLFFVLSSIVLSVSAFIKLSFYINYNVKISASALFVIFETNGSEASDFLVLFFNYKIIGLLILFVVLLMTSLLLFKIVNIKSEFLSKPLRLLSVVIIFFTAFCIHRKLSNENLILTSFNSYQDYKTAKANLKETLAMHDTENIKQIVALEEQQTYVIVIGESTSNWHMQLYGYERETNPLLSEIENELLVFDSVIAPNVHTILALDKVLTLSDYSKPNKKENASIVQLANKAGFNTFWISNQKPVGLHESIPTIIGSAAKYKNFIATDKSDYDIYDQDLLSHLENALNNSAQKKLIFLHLIGSHSSYKRRYPKAFNVFKGETNTVFKNAKAKKIINEYDNTVLYNDFVVREIIEKVKSQNENSYVVYFSDHGDEVYDTFDFVGHSEYHGTRPMYEIPFIAWFSKKYKAENTEMFNIQNLTKRPYLLEDFIHSFSEISNITFDKFNPEKSIFNRSFKKKKRLIKKGEDYDKR